MPEKFKFKYLDGDHIKRLQSNVNKKLYQELKNDDVGSGSVVAGQPVSSTKDDQTSISPKDVVASSTAFNNGTSKGEDISVPNLNESPNVPKFSNSKLKHRQTFILRNRLIERLKPDIRSTTPEIVASHQTDVDDTETILARITCSHRAICTVVDSLVPNLLYKPHFETPLDAERCRKRFEAFLRMFTRNYSYPIELMLTDIQFNECLSPNAFIYKINSLYNILQVALAAYTTNVRNCLDHTVPPLIIDLLQFIRQTTKICVDRMFFDEEDCIVQNILDKVNKVLLELETINMGMLEDMGKTNSITKSSKKHPRNFSMYNSPSIPNKSSKKNSTILKSAKYGSGMIQTRLKQANTLSVSTKGDAQQQHEAEEVKPKSEKPSRCYRTILTTPKLMTQPASVFTDKIRIKNYEFNNKEFHVTDTLSSRSPLPSRSFVDSINRTTSAGLMAETELFKSKNAKYSQVISAKDIVIDSQVNTNHTSNGDVQTDAANRQLRLDSRKIHSFVKGREKERNVNLLECYQSKKPNKFLSRLSEELDDEPIETFHKSLDLGERLFIEKFLALETSI